MRVSRRTVVLEVVNPGWGVLVDEASVFMDRGCSGSGDLAFSSY